jgi:hypothetical protein
MSMRRTVLADDLLDLIVPARLASTARFSAAIFRLLRQMLRRLAVIFVVSFDDLAIP